MMRPSWYDQLPMLVEEVYYSVGPWASTGVGQNGHFILLVIGM